MFVKPLKILQLVASALCVVGYAFPAIAQSTIEPALPPESEAPIALLVDISSGQVLHQRNAERRFVPASITKAMTSYTAFELIEEAQLSPAQFMTIRPESWREWNGKGSTMWLDAESPVSVDDLLIGINTVSANDASIVLAEGASGSVAEWTALMNAKARALGMTNSHFATPNGWPDEGQTFTTASDLVKLARALVETHPKKYARYIGRPNFTWSGIAQRNHDPLIGRIRGADGIKTGSTNEAGFGYLGSAKRNGQRLVLVIAGADRYRARARMARSYMEWGFSAFDQAQLFQAGQVISTARVQDGAARGVGLKADGAVRVNVPKGRTAELKARIRYNGPVRAPILQGEQIAVLEVEVPGMESAYIPLVAASDVDRAGFFSRIFNGIAGWVS